MQLLPYPESHHIQVKLDWLELSCLSNIYFTVRISELRNILENLDSFTSSDIGEEDAEVENEIQRLLEQYQQRKDILGESYPFVWKVLQTSNGIYYRLLQLLLWLVMFKAIVFHSVGQDQIAQDL